jgi:hypothetical protein
MIQLAEFRRGRYMEPLALLSGSIGYLQSHCAASSRTTSCFRIDGRPVLFTGNAAESLGLVEGQPATIAGYPDSERYPTLSLSGDSGLAEARVFRAVAVRDDSTGRVYRAASPSRSAIRLSWALAALFL